MLQQVTCFGSGTLVPVASSRCSREVFSGSVAFAINASLLSMPATVNLFWSYHGCFS
jgi:hypothetical protein